LPDWTSIAISALGFITNVILLPIVRTFLKSYASRIDKLEERHDLLAAKMAELSTAQSVQEANYQNISRQIDEVKRMLERLLDRSGQ
jgi:hypothetical protein